ncbi:MAG: hypothetical protein L7F77_03265 [Candidatus Magnetominusculus sp. LBB02]|nr:hypothetical protein [Candidatus Magnetominusculus sp. LBB02]
MKKDGWESERNSWPDNIKKIIGEGKLGVVLQCGGRGRRLGRFEPKPLVNLDKETRPLDNLIKDIPPEIPIYLHGMEEDKVRYFPYLAARSSFGRKVSYIVQEEAAMYEDYHCLRKIQYPDGCVVTGSRGPATFIKQFASPPPYLFVTDGSKVGINFRDVVEALKLLINPDEQASIIAFTFTLRDDELDAEIKKSDRTGEHTRYARVDVEKQRVYEYPDRANKDLIKEIEYPALAGMYVVVSELLLSTVKKNEGLPTRLESVNTLYSGFVRQLKMSMVMRGFSDFDKDKGLPFGIYPLERDKPTFEKGAKRLYVRGIKSEVDLDRYKEGKDLEANYLAELRGERDSIAKTEKENIGLLLNCAEWNDGLGKLVLGALESIEGGERPITCLFKDTPPKVPVYLHLSQKSKPALMELLNKYQYFNHDVSYIIQAGTQLIDDNGRPFTDPLGIKIMASDGPATFGRSLNLNKTPEYLIIVDGNRTGLDYNFIEEDVLKILTTASENIVILIRKLTTEERKDETARISRKEEKKRRRYAMVRRLEKIDECCGSNKCNLYKSKMDSDVLYPADPNADGSTIWKDPTAFALCGVSVVKTVPFIQHVNNLLANKAEDNIPLTKCWSFNTLHPGHARALKMSMCLQGYVNMKGGMPFLAYEIPDELYFHSIKEDNDIELYKQKLADGKYERYRQHLPAWKK